MQTDAFAELKSNTSLEVTPKANCKTANKTILLKKTEGRVEVRREKTGRSGKTVTTLKAFPKHIPLKMLERMTFEFKKQCACGGTLKGRAIELQGDVCDQACDKLTADGFQPVRAGG